MAQPSAPHYLRFAAALAMVSGLSGCALDHTRETDAGPPPDTGPLADAGHDAPDTCDTCVCVYGGDTPPPPNSCEALGLSACCYILGPLPPPDLA